MPYNPKSLQNLKKFKSGDRTHEQCVADGRIGGLKSVEVKRQRKLMKETLQELLTKPTRSKSVKNEIKKLGLIPDIQTSAMLGLVKKAEKGDVKAIELMAKMNGELTDKHEIDASVSVEDFFKDHELKP